MDDVVFLSRVQFALTVMFHYIFPPLSIGLGLVIAILEGIYMKTGKEIYLQATKFWTKIFALTFSLGVATGIVLLFSFGTNWARYATFVGDVFGSTLAAEGIFTFMTEAGFLGIMLFGWNRVRPAIHYLSTLMVVGASAFSSVWIVAANSWMQTPAGYHIVGEGRLRHAVVSNFWEMLLSPSFFHRVSHTLLGCWLAGAFLVLSISAYYLLRKRHLPLAKVSFKVAFGVCAVTLLLQGVAGDVTARGVAVNQPAKLAAMEGVFKTEKGTGLNLFGVVNEKEGRVEKNIALPGLLSFLIYRNFEHPVTGLDQIPRDEWPPVQIVFQAYHIMITMWVVMAVALALALYAWKRGNLTSSPWILRILVFSALAPQIANQSGWVTAEVGRQPWIIHGVMRTTEAASSNLQPYQIWASLSMFAFIYLIIGSLFLFLLNRKIQAGPDGLDEPLYRDL